MKDLKEFIIKYKYILLFILGFCLLYIRSSYNFKNPIVYAEEGVWLSDIMESGFRWTVINARSDYFTFFITGMIKFADVIDMELFKGNLSYIPYIFAVISYAFISFIAILPSLTFGDRLNKWGKLFLFFGIILLPMGHSATEIIGRVLQFHFYMWIMVFCLLIYRYDNKEKRKWLIVLTDLLILGCIATNPSVLLLVFVYALIELYNIVKKYINKKKINIKEMFALEFSKYSTWQMVIFFLAVLILGLIIIYKMTHAVMDFEEGGKVSNIVEFLIRSISYIFVWPFYDSLNIKTGIIVLILTIVFYLYNYILVKPNSKKLYAISTASLFAITLITLKSRFFLTNHLEHFTAFAVPDRYYILMNMTSLFPIAFIISDGFEKCRRLLKLEAYALMIFFIGVVIVNKNNVIIQHEDNYLDWFSGVTFEERMNNAYLNNSVKKGSKNENMDVYEVDIDPWWKMEVPVDRLKRSIGK